MAARHDELTLFVREALAKGIPRAQIEQALLDVGWHPDRVNRALTGFADVGFPVPVPRPLPYGSAGEAFGYLVLFTAAGVTAFSVVELFFARIDYLFYDPASAPLTRAEWSSGVRWSVARALIAFPVFLVTSWLIARSFARDPSERTSAIRRWLTYIAMFLAVLAIIGDLITLVAYVLAGETTARFLLKVLVVALVAGLVLGYYLRDLREGNRRSVAKPVLVAAGLAWLIAVVSGLWLVGSPSEESARRIDDRRVDDLRALSGGVDVFYERNSTLPKNLDAMASSLRTNFPFRDPDTGAPYRYLPGDGKTFELCADFARASEDVLADSVWTHGAGEQCFTLTAGDKERR